MSTPASHSHSRFVRISRWCAHHRWQTFVGWVALVVAVSVLGSTVGTAKIDDFRLPGTESQRAYDVLAEHSPQQNGLVDQLVYVARDGTLKDRALQARIDRSLELVRKDPIVVDVAAPRLTPDGRIGVVDVTYQEDFEELEPDDFKSVQEAAFTARGARAAGRARRHRRAVRALRRAGAGRDGVHRLLRRVLRAARDVRIAHRGRHPAADRRLRDRRDVRLRAVDLARRRHARLRRPARGADRHRRRDRLRADRRHALPRRARPRPGARGGAAAGDGHGRPDGLLRRLHGDHRAARPAAARPVVPARRRRRVGDRRRADDARRADAAARAAEPLGPVDRPPARAVARPEAPPGGGRRAERRASASPA